MKTMTAAQILEGLEDSEEDWRNVQYRIYRQAPIKEILPALETTRDQGTRRILVYVLGNRRARSVVPALIPMLDDPELRPDVVDALGKIGHPGAGPALWRRLAVEPDEGTRQMLIPGLGAVCHRERAPVVIDALRADSAGMRYAAAWALRHLRLEAARPALVAALGREPEDWVARALRGAIEQLG